MYYYEVWAAHASFHGGEALTYSYDSQLKIGSVVIVPLRRLQVLGIVAAKAGKPKFATKPIVKKVTNQPLPPTSLELLSWLKEYYPSPSGVLAQQFLPSGLLQAPRQKTDETDVPVNLKAVNVPPLIAGQQKAVDTVLAETTSTVLLHGDTGTGKTRIYLELTATMLKQGRSVLVLTPEISLTPQLVREFEATFHEQVLLVHSNLTPAERRDTWLKILQTSVQAGTDNQPHFLKSDHQQGASKRTYGSNHDLENVVGNNAIIVIGPRSALFSPIANLGLIVVDEAHEPAYKQEQAPYYQALRVASKLAQLHKAKLVFGTATPPVSEYYIAKMKGAPIIRLTELPAARKDNKETETIVVSLKDRDLFGRQPHLSKPLLNGIKNALNNGEQSLVFLNRRGTARLIMCQACGWQSVCPHCDLPLTYHGDTHNARCHTCGYHTNVPPSCPACHSARYHI